MDATPPAARFAPPLLGQDTAATLKALLGVKDAELAAWRENHVI
jgi:crotonobetainyl-CoA:carnitine CoA-transferase CaiB-like acyl-CoA transferase